MLSPTARATAVDRYGNVVGSSGNMPLTSLGGWMGNMDRQQGALLAGGGTAAPQGDWFGTRQGAAVMNNIGMSGVNAFYQGSNRNPGPRQAQYHANVNSRAQLQPYGGPGGANGPWYAGGGSSSGTVGGGFENSRDLYDTWKTRLKGQLENPGISAQTEQKMVNRATDQISEREASTRQQLTDRVAAMGGSNSGAMQQGLRKVASEYGGQIAKTGSDIRVGVEQDRQNRLYAALGLSGSYLSQLEDRQAADARMRAAEDRADGRAQMVSGGGGGAPNATPFAGGFNFNFGTNEGGGANFSDRYGDRMWQQGGMTGGSGLLGDQYGGGVGNEDISRVNTPSGFASGATRGTYMDQRTGAMMGFNSRNQQQQRNMFYV